MDTPTEERHISPTAAKKQDGIPSETTAKPIFDTMELELEDEIQQQEEETIGVVAVALLLTTLTRFGTQGIPYNDLPLSGEDYTIAILQGNPRRTLDVFRVTTPTFMFICRELLSVQMEPVSKLLQVEEQLRYFCISLRNVIERCFGVFKRRFKIMTQASEYQLEQQYDLVLACACLHNINVRKNGYYDIIFDESLAMAEQYRATDTEDPPPKPEYPSERERQHCENWRDSIAEGLWTQYMQTLQEQLR
ncbi:hypothetical protein H4Q26_003359 [Puccinia striiformis f. sp. tritici PST-130]|nr:hypothetical protein H4Q26_003359 [Puccinia striiformis f. sp. tritici PST-130]